MTCIRYCAAFATFALKCSSSQSFCGYAWDQTPPDNSVAADSIHADKRATINSTTNCIETLDASTQQGLVAETRSWKSSVMGDGEKNLKCPSGLSKNCVWWWRELCILGMRQCAALPLGVGEWQQCCTSWVSVRRTVFMCKQIGHVS